MSNTAPCPALAAAESLQSMARTPKHAEDIRILKTRLDSSICTGERVWRFIGGVEFEAERDPAFAARLRQVAETCLK